MLCSRASPIQSQSGATSILRRAPPILAVPAVALSCEDSFVIRYGILGFGLHAAKRLMPGFEAAQSSRAVALARRDRDAAARCAAEFGIPHWFTSAEELCGAGLVDAVIVTTPNSCHRKDVLTAVGHGLPVLCEKPMALNSAECEQMIGAADSAGVLLGVAQCFRFSSSVNLIRRWIADGRIGQPVFARAEFAFNAIGHARRWIADHATAGGGPVADIGVHCIDALRYLLSREVTTVTAIATRDSHSGDVEAGAELMLEFDGQVLANVAVSNRLPYHTEVVVQGTAATIRCGGVFRLDGVVTVELWQDGKLAESAQVSNAATFSRQIDAFSEAIEQQTPFAVPGAEGLANQRVVDAAYESIRSGTRQKLG